jgi:hypothetical protein
MEMTVAKAVHKDIFSIQKWAFKYDIKLTPYTSLIMSVMTYACLTWEYGADGHLLKLLRLQNTDIYTRTLVRELHVAFKTSYVCDYINKSCRIQAEVIKNHENQNVRGIGCI